jgi:hypothetical protein
MLVSKVRDTHRRLVVSRQLVWGDRISENAADKSMRFLEFMLVGYVQAVPFMVLAFVSMKLGLSSLAYASLGIGAIIGLSCFLVFGLHYGKQAGLDIARSYGLPDRIWWRVRVKTPAQFDGWLAKERRKQGLKDPGVSNPKGEPPHPKEA